jgi:hypothetical protein
MRTTDRVLLSYYVSSILITFIPLPWWYYSVGGIFVVYDSPFQISVSLLGSNLILAKLLNLFLNAFRIYVGINLVYNSLMLVRGKQVAKYSTMAWLPLFYMLDPLLIYVVFNYVISSVTGDTFRYPLLIIGVEDFVTSYNNVNIDMLIFSYPTLLYWFTFIPTILYITALITGRKSSKS